MSEARKSFIEDPAVVEVITLEAVDRCMNVVDEACRESKFDASAMIYMSVHVASHLVARALFFGDGPVGREMLRNKMLDNVSEILDSARQHIDQSERELNEGQIIRPN